MTRTKFCTSCGAPGTTGDFCAACGHALESRAAASGGEAPAAGAGEPAAASSASSAQEHVSASATAVAPASRAYGNGHAAPSVGAGPREAAAAQRSSPGPADGHLNGGGSRNQDKSPWLPIGLSVGIVVLLCAAAAVVLVVAGGKPGARAKSGRTGVEQVTNAFLASRQLYVSTQQANYSALLPAGWQQISAKSQSLTGAITVRSPVDNGARITVGQLVNAPTALSAEAATLMKSASKQPGFRQDSAGQATLGGGRSGWELGYEANGQSNAYYLLRSCNNTYAVSASAPPDRVSLLRSRIAIVAGTLQGNC